MENKGFKYWLFWFAIIYLIIGVLGWIYGTLSYYILL